MITLSRSLRLAIPIALLLAACSTTLDDAYTGPPIPTGEVPQAVLDDLSIVATPAAEFLDLEAVARLGESGDPRVGWVLADVLRFTPAPSPPSMALVRSINAATGLDLDENDLATWVAAMNQFLEWELPTPLTYREVKADLYGQVDPLWEELILDESSPMAPEDLLFGGVRPDLRALDDNSPCAGCIPSLDHPTVTDAAGGNWYQDHKLVFGVVVDGEARAYPRHQLEIHELVNDTLGGREIAVPYCTLCGSAQAFLVDDVADERLVLRTSGLLHRSNKVMYDLTTESFVDTFAGVGVSGTLAGVEIPQVAVSLLPWGEWKAAHPDTTILAEDGGIGREYPEDPLAGRDANGPVFPVGPVDPRLGSVERVIGVVDGDRTVAFSKAALLEAGSAELDGVGVVVADGGFDAGGLAVQEAYWFAWSQFHPQTEVWPEP